MTKLGNYNVIKQIGEGGFGRTYEAEHIYLNEKACLKQNINLTPQDSALLRAEAKLLWNVHHYSLPAVTDYFPAKDNSYVLAMSFIEGKTLDAEVKKHQAIHPEDVSWITQRLLNACFYLHNKGIIHCDIKPANIIVQPLEHNAILVDYGLSCLRPTRTTSALGYTAVFAAPEVANGKPPTPAADLYSLGLTMIYALGGNPITKTTPDTTPPKLQQFLEELTQYDPLERPTWKNDLVRRISDIRQETFGRRISKGG